MCPAPSSLLGTFHLHPPVYLAPSPSPHAHLLYLLHLHLHPPTYLAPSPSKLTLLAPVPRSMCQHSPHHALCQHPSVPSLCCPHPGSFPCAGIAGHSLRHKGLLAPMPLAWLHLGTDATAVISLQTPQLCHCPLSSSLCQLLLALLCPHPWCWSLTPRHEPNHCLCSGTWLTLALALVLFLSPSLVPWHWFLAHLGTKTWLTVAPVHGSSLSPPLVPWHWLLAYLAPLFGLSLAPPLGSLAALPGSSVAPSLVL